MAAGSLGRSDTVVGSGWRGGDADEEGEEGCTSAAGTRTSPCDARQFGEETDDWERLWEQHVRETDRRVDEERQSVEERRRADRTVAVRPLQGASASPSWRERARRLLCVRTSSVGGAAKWRRILEETKEVAPACARQCLQEAERAFRPNAPGKSRWLIRQCLDAEEEERSITPTQPFTLATQDSMEKEAPSFAQ